MLLGFCSPFLAQSSKNLCKSLSDKNIKGIFCSIEVTLDGLLDGSWMRDGHQKDLTMI